MGFMNNSMNGNDDVDPDEQEEEQYLTAFKKHARDFVTREDLQELLDQMMSLVDPLGLSPISIGDSHARNTAQRYQRYLDKGKPGESERDVIQVKDKKENKR